MKSSQIILAFTLTALGLGALCEASQSGPSGGEQPKVEALPETHYVAVRTRVSEAQLSKVIPASIGQVSAWLGARGAHPSGPPFVRYVVVDMPRHLDIEVGFPVLGSMIASGPIRAGAFPAGRYVTYTYTGSYDGLSRANATALDWARKNRISLDQKPSKEGVVWAGRLEYYLTDPSKEPDPKKFKTKILFRVAK